MGRIKPRWLILAMLGGLYAASAEAQRLELGIRGGYGRSNEVTATTICTLECGPSQISHHFPRVAATGGIVLRRQASEWLAVRGELAFAPKGYGPGDERSDWRVAAQYLEVPVLVDVRILPVGTGGVLLSGGVAPAVLISCQVSGTTQDRFVRTGCGERRAGTGAGYGPAVAYDLGWAIAPAVRWPTRSGAVLLEVRHTRGLVDVQPERDGRTRNHATAMSLTTTWSRP